MPIYDYRCDECGHVFSAVQSYSETAIQICPNCGKRPRRLISMPAIVFKGGGWYKTDSRGAAPKETGDTGSSGATGTDTKADKAEKGEKSEKSEKGEQTKTDTKSGSKSDTKSDTSSAKKTESKPATAPKSEAKS